MIIYSTTENRKEINMKKLIILFILFLPFTAKADYYLQTALIAHSADWMQTRYIVQNKEFHEKNPILGRHPSMSRVNNYFVVTLFLIIIINNLIPEKYRAKYRKYLAYALTLNVARNRFIGLRIKLK